MGQDQSHGRLMDGLPSQTRARLRDRLRERSGRTMLEEMERAGSDRVIARLDGRALASNLRVIRELVPGQGILPMIKADGYGHGSVWVARELLDLPGLSGMGVATFDEAVELRKELGHAERRLRIVVFAGAVPWTEAKGHLCEKHGLTPVIATDSDWQAFLKGGWPERVSYELKFNTGMNRLGISLGRAPSIAKALRERRASWHPDGIFSHLAMAEKPESRLTRIQLDRFIWLRRELSTAFPSAQFHLANSAAIWNAKLLGLRDLTDIVRPGLSLYGIPPWKDAPTRGLLAVMTLEAQVIHLHQLKEGESVGYGATFTVGSAGAVSSAGALRGESGAGIAILAGGYADGISRSLSNRGQVFIHGKIMRFAGNISMDLSAATCPAGTRRGEWARILGPEIDPWAQAEAAGTIPYELLTSVAPRVKRIHV